MPKPRNLTAAAYDQRIANPPAAHIKDSVSNTAPGLEFDERTIEKHAFPGLVLEFQRQSQDESPDFPVVRTIDQAQTASVDGSTGILTFPTDDRNYLFVYAIRSLDPRSPDIYRFYDFGTRDSPFVLDCWNAIRNLPCREGQHIALLIGRGGLPDDKVPWEQAKAAFGALSPAKASNQQFPEKPSRRNKLVWAVLVQRRAPLEDPDTGLLFPNVPPGDLQSTMCTPWHYDFRDCHCYYWASARPDMVSGEGPEERNVHFMRKRKPVWEKIPIPPEVWGADPDKPEQAKKQREALWNHVETINDWETLPVVLNNTEVRSRYRTVVEKLQVLAGIEHGLAVEYLYAYQSVDPDFTTAEGEPLGQQAREVLRRIATDEMRHFRWVNEILELLRQETGGSGIKAIADVDERIMTIIDRAGNYGPNFDWRNFELRPLDVATLDWFIRVEKPSRQVRTDEQLEGLYISVVREIGKDVEEKGEHSAFGNSATVQKILGLVKLIIEEGDGHYRQLADLRHRLFGRADSSEHLRAQKADPPPGQIERARHISDSCYHALLFGLGRMFLRGDDEDGRRLQQLVDLMKRMDELNDYLARLGYPAEFNKAPVSPATEQWGTWKNHLAKELERLRLTLDTIGMHELRSRAGGALDAAADCCQL